ncbi:Methyltransferase small domain-containing protein [Caloranaerobacter azorensis DSM 13643]|uniref:Methyltransferase small domain-containing protein n=1 Tax=Caloranaerobacter azorensis DSM 13643 TaxID=1121264 RepID=A0A1M5S3G0_9FIRM|nr:methyltransferase [Caloranaerobacter azorensis]SHH32493.1 Methyltransferase small domain-containing protein [Caloranaerobacter azorensis DSM 13643]
MIKIQDKYVNNLREILELIDYKFIISNVRGIYNFIDPWFADVKTGERVLKCIPSYLRNIFEFMLLGKSMNVKELEEIIGKKRVTLLLESGLAYSFEDQIRLNDYTVIVYQQLYFLVDLNCKYETCQDKYPNTYIGYDSYRLGENILFKRNTKVLDLCSGSGIQGILAARSASEVYCVELNPVAANMAIFNVKLNELEDKVRIIEGDLFNEVKGQKFDIIYSNPPFIPMIKGVNYPICGDGGEDGLFIVRKIIGGLQEHLNENGEFIMFCQMLGDEENIFYLEELKNNFYDKKWKVEVISTDRMYLGFQNRSVTELTKMINPDIDKNIVISRLEKIYRSMNAKYLYTTLIKIKQNNKLNNIDINLFKLFNDVHYEDRMIVKNNLSIEQNKEQFIVCSNGKILAQIDRETKDLLMLSDEFKGKKSIEELVDILIEKKNLLVSNEKIDLSREKIIMDTLSVCKILQESNVIEILK